MLETLLQTKLSLPPARSDLVPRPHLIDLLQGGRQKKLTLISAPAGFGKTTLLSAWHAPLAADGWGVAWVSLDAHDDDSVRFWSYIIGALDTIHPGIGATALPLLRARHRPPIETILTTILNALTTTPAPIILVLDDYHLITTEAIHHALAFLIGHLPASLHLVIASRTDPPLPLARLRVRGELVELRADQLRFSSSEATEFFTTTSSLALSTDDVAALTARTEGWIAGLHLAALSLRGRADPHAFVAALAGDDRYIADYLVEEVLLRQPSEIQAFLLHTAILDRLCGPLCDAVTEQRGSSALLEELERRNVFLVPLDTRQEWYRYHHLFADLLRERLRRTQPEVLPLLHQRASTWYEQRGWLSDAVHHALTAHDAAHAAQLVAQHAEAMLARGEVLTVVRWLDELPVEQVRAHPRLGLMAAWSRMLIGEWAAIEPALQAAEQAIYADSDDAAARNADSLAEIDALRAIVAIEHGDTTPSTMALARQARDRLPQTNAFLRGGLAYALGMAYRASGDMRAAVAAFAEAWSLGTASADLLTALVANYELAQAHAEQGALRQAVALHRQALHWVEQRLGPSMHQFPLAGAGAIGLGNVLYEWNELDLARQQLEMGVALTREQGGLGLARDGYVALAFLCQAQGDAGGADDWMAQAEAIARIAPRPDALSRLRPAQVRLWLAQGQLAAAQAWAAQCGLAINQVPAYADEAAYMCLVRVALSQAGRHEEHAERLQRALAVLAQLLQWVMDAGRMARAIEILIVQALACHALGEMDQARTALQRGLALAEPEGYVRVFVDCGPPLPEILAQIAGAESPVAPYAQRLLNAFLMVNAGARWHGDTRRGSHADAVIPSTGHPSPPSLVEELSERERAVLRLLTAGLSNQEIAAQLVIAEGTVKKHTHNIFGKLGVRNRSQAIVRAQELHLV